VLARRSPLGARDVFFTGAFELMRGVVVFLSAAVGGCLVENPLFQGGEATSGVPSTATTEAATTEAAMTSLTSTSSSSSTTSGTSGTTGALTSSASETTQTTETTETSDTSETSETSDTSETSEQGPPYVPGVVDCKGVLKSDPALMSGIYRVDVAEEPQQTVELYCDMDTAGGGWTLVGRSVAEASPGDFGWSSARGAVEDDAAPYSLDAGALGLEFAEILVGDRGEGKSWGENAFVLNPAPEGFIDEYQSDEMEVKVTPLESNLCPLINDVLMLRYLGNTALDQVFWARDKVFDGKNYGLQAGGFDLFYHDHAMHELACWRTGKLSLKQGMIMVR